MSYKITIEEAQPRILAAAHARANDRNIGDTIGRLLQPVWQFVKENELTNTGHSVTVYHGEGDDCFFSDEGVPIEVGAEVLDSFESTDAIRHYATPGGRVAHTLHVGPYHLLTQAHAAVRQWCEENGHAMTGLSWEIYGHHHDDPAKLETEVCYLLR